MTKGYDYHVGILIPPGATMFQYKTSSLQVTDVIKRVNGKIVTEENRKSKTYIEPVEYYDRSGQPFMYIPHYTS